MFTEDQRCHALEHGHVDSLTASGFLPMADGRRYRKSEMQTDKSIRKCTRHIARLMSRGALRQPGDARHSPNEVIIGRPVCVRSMSTEPQASRINDGFIAKHRRTINRLSMAFG